MYFAALAFPGLTEEEARSDAAAAWVASYLRKANEVDETDDPFEDDRLNRYMQFSPEWCRAKLRTAMRRVKDRSKLARAVRPWIRDALGKPQAPIPGVKKFTQRQIALYLNNDNPDQAANFERRIWRPGRPVIHLAIAADLVLCDVGGEITDFEIDLASVDAIGTLVREAEKTREMILADPRFNVAEGDLLRLEWLF